MRCRHLLPGFRTTCLAVCVLYVLLGASILARGPAPAMAQFGLPQATLDSPHYIDAIWWVYTHMIVIGLMLGVVGLFAKSLALRLWMARLMLVAHVYYTFMDFRASDSALGVGLYHGPASVFPAIIALVVTILFAHLSFCSTAIGTPSQREGDDAPSP